MAVAMHPTPHHHHHLHNHLREFQFQYLQRDQLGPTALINNNNYNTGWYCPSTSSSASSYPSFSGSSPSFRRESSWNRAVRAEAFWQSLSKPTSIEMEAIEGMEEFEEALRQAKELSRPIVVDWMAAWCRKCIYLKPKLEKLAAEYQDKVKFYYIDVNKVPQALVKLADISKMPTIQLWKDDKMKEEVIGGHKAWLVVDEVREMIDKHLRN